MENDKCIGEKDSSDSQIKSFIQKNKDGTFLKCENECCFVGKKYIVSFIIFFSKPKMESHYKKEKRFFFFPSQQKIFCESKMMNASQKEKF